MTPGHSKVEAGVTTLEKVHQQIRLLVGSHGDICLVGLHPLSFTSRNQLSAPDGQGFSKTNGDFVSIGNIAIKTNSSLNTDEFKQYMWRVHLLDQIGNSGLTNATDKLVEGAQMLVKDYPNGADGYQIIMEAVGDYEFEAKPEKAKQLASEMIESSAPAGFKLWAKGFLNRLDSSNHPVSMQFSAVDGREVDLARMRGKVVLVDSGALYCGPCVAELPQVKAAWDKFHAQGFEVIGISCDTDKRNWRNTSSSTTFHGHSFLTANRRTPTNSLWHLVSTEFRICFCWIERVSCVSTMCGQEMMSV